MPLPTASVGPDVVHILLIGGDGYRIYDINTDTLIVLVVDKKAKQVSMLSIPRDLWVQIPGHEPSRINRVYRLGNGDQYPDGGPALLMRVIEENLGIPVDHWVVLQLDGFKAVVDALGGVDLAVSHRLRVGYKDPVQGDVVKMILEPGVYHMDGETALHYVRTRLDDGVFGRARRNQQVLRALWDQTKDTDLVVKIPALWSALRGSFETDLSLADVLALVPAALSLEPERVRSLYIGPAEAEPWTTPDGWWVLVPDRGQIQRLVSSLYAPPPADEALNSRATRIQLQNGTDCAQLELVAADQLHWQGFDVVETGMADGLPYEKTTMIVFADKSRGLADLARLLHIDDENIQLEPDSNSSVDLRIILGQDYGSCG